MGSVVELNGCKGDSVLKRVVALMVFATMAIGAAWAAENPFLGQWKMNSAKTRTPDEMKIESQGGNKFAFNFGPGAETITVDGTDQPGVGGTMLSVKADGPDTWIVERKQNGKLLIHATWTLSKDGSTLTDNFREFVSAETTLSVDYVYQRHGAGEGIAGDWQSIKETWNTPIILTVRPYQGDGLSFSIPAELDTKNAKLDGKEYPDPIANLTTSIQPVDERNLQMTNKYGGSILDTREIAVSADGKTLTLTVHTPGKHEPDVMVFDRQ